MPAHAIDVDEAGCLAYFYNLTGVQDVLVALAGKVYPRRAVMSNELLEPIMRRYVGGELRAFDELYARVAPRVLGYLLSMTRDRVWAEDLCQTTFFKLHRGREGWIPGAPVIPWVMAIARNTFYDDAQRARRARVRVTSTGDVPDLPDLDLADMSEQPSAELTEIVARAMDALPVLQREALALTTLGGLTHRDAAAALDTTEMAVKLRVHRAYEALRAALHTRRRSR